MDNRRDVPVWLWIVIAVACFRYVQRNLFLASRFIDGSWSDFSHYYLAARALLHGTSPYTVFNFDYPPLVAFLVLPLAILPYPAARVTWFLLSQLFILGAGWLTWRASGRDRIATLSIVLTWSLCGTVAENLVLGQVNGLLMLLVAVAMTECLAAPGAIGLATALKLWPGVLAVRYLVLGRWRRFLVAVATGVVLIAVPLGFIALATNGDPLPRSGRYWMGTPAILNVSLPATVLRLADFPEEGGALPAAWVTGDDPRQLHLAARDGLLSVTSALLTLAIGFGLLLAVSRRKHPTVPALTGALVSLALAASPIAWFHYQLLQLPGIAWLAAHTARRRKPGTLALVVLAAGAVTWAHKLDFFFKSTAGMVLARGAMVAALDLVLFSLFLTTMMEPGRNAAAGDPGA